MWSSWQFFKLVKSFVLEVIFLEIFFFFGNNLNYSDFFCHTFSAYVLLLQSIFSCARLFVLLFFLLTKSRKMTESWTSSMEWTKQKFAIFFKNKYDELFRSPSLGTNCFCSRILIFLCAIFLWISRKCSDFLATKKKQKQFFFGNTFSSFEFPLF